MKYCLIIVSVVLLIFSCKSSENVAGFNMKDEDSLFVEMERSVCFGACPWYILKIYESGYATYEGKKHVDKNGLHTTTFTSEDLKTIYDEMERIKFFELKDKYDNPNVTDLPSTQISVQVNGKRKSIYDRFDSPVALNNFEKLIDQISDSKEWTKRMPVDHQ